MIRFVKNLERKKYLFDLQGHIQQKQVFENSGVRFKDKNVIIIAFNY